MTENLQSYCLNTIVDEFERYFLLYSASKDKETLRNFEFLQRKHSFNIISRLYAKKRMQKKYIDFLINKYLRVLDTRWFKGCAWETTITKFAEIGSNIEKLCINERVGSSGESEWNTFIDIIELMPNLKFASFLFDCTDKMLKSIAEFCPNILEIDLTLSSITNDGIKNLCLVKNGKRCCTKLKKLSIAPSKIKDESVRYLIENLPSLEVITYPDLPVVIYSLHKDDLSTLDQVKPYNITNLDLLNFVYAPYFSNLLKVCLSVCPHLQHLACPFLTEDHLSMFPKLINIEKLHLHSLSNSAVNINTLLKLNGEKLLSLTVFNCIVSLSVLAESCPRLKELLLQKISFLCDGDLKFVFQSLESCVFDTAMNDSATIKAISLLFSSSPKLESLSFKECSLLPEMKVLILKCCENSPIKKLSFWETIDVDTEFLKDILLNCHSLKFLNLESCDIGERDARELCQFAQILPNNPHVYISDNFNFAYDDDLDDAGGDDDYFNDYYFNYDYLLPSDYEEGDSDDCDCYFEL